MTASLEQNPQLKPSPEHLPVYGPITAEDRAWLGQLGCEWPDAINEDSWLADLNETVLIGSTHIKDAEASSPQAVSRVFEAREQFFDKLTAIAPGVSEFRERHPSLMPLDTVIGNQRTLYEAGIDGTKVINDHPEVLGYRAQDVAARLDNLTKHGIDGTKVINSNPIVLYYSIQAVNNKLDNLTSHGINAAKAVNGFPKIVGYATDSVNVKIDNLTARGILAAKVVETTPNVLGYAVETINNKLDNLTSHGINAAKAVNGFPKIVGLESDSVNKKLNIFYAAARAWKVEDYRAVVNRIVEDVPAILGGKPDKLRTLVRIFSHGYPAQNVSSISSKDILNVYINNLEATLAGYLEHGSEIHEPRDVYRVGRKQKKLGKAALIEIIASHQEDPAVKAYKHGYPLD